MLKYLVVLLDDTSTSYCHYNVEKKERKLISLEDLHDGIKFAMLENLTIQFVLPDYKLPDDYWREIVSIDNAIISPAAKDFMEWIPRGIWYKLPEVIVLNSIESFCNCHFVESASYVLRINKCELFKHYKEIPTTFENVKRLNIVITDVDSFSDENFQMYKTVLGYIGSIYAELLLHGKSPEINIITDRLHLSEMNNCEAGDSSITLAPDGHFYVCPAFYQANSDIELGKTFSIGSLKEGVKIPSSHIYKLTHAPLCRKCDAFQCKRCVWLNRKTTYEINTPSHEQCVISHLERNASRDLLIKMRKRGQFMSEKEIKKIDYLDPFENEE